jgi:hypothetical protein
MSTSAYAGSETGNTLIFDADDSDPRNYTPLKADRAQRIRYPCTVGNTFKNVTEQVYAAAGGTIPAAQFVTGRVLFNAGASGTIALPTAAAIVTLLNRYYRQIVSRSSVFTNSAGVGNRIVNEINVEFLNNSGVDITISAGAGVTFVGVTSGFTIPTGVVATYRFVITSTNPAAIDVFPSFASTGGGGYLNLTQGNPGNMVVYNPITHELSYVGDSNLSDLVGPATTIMAWDPVTSTPKKYTIDDSGPPSLPLFRDTTLGTINTAPQSTYPNGTTTNGAAIQVQTNGSFALRIATPPLIQQSTGQVVPTGGPTLLTFATNATVGTPDCTYNAGIFTTTTTNSYSVHVSLTQAATAANNIYQLRSGSVVGAGTVIWETGPTTNQTYIAFTAYLNMAALGTSTFHLECVNNSGGNVVIASGVSSQVQVGYVRT